MASTGKRRHSRGNSLCNSFTKSSRSALEVRFRVLSALTGTNPHVLSLLTSIRTLAYKCNFREDTWNGLKNHNKKSCSLLSLISSPFLLALNTSINRVRKGFTRSLSCRLLRSRCECRESWLKKESNLRSLPGAEEAKNVFLAGN